MTSFMAISSKTKILGVGSYSPTRRLSNDELSKIVETSDDWISSRTGIRERRIASEAEATSDLSLIAAKRALEDAQISPEDIEVLFDAGQLHQVMWNLCSNAINHSKMERSNVMINIIIVIPAFGVIVVIITTEIVGVVPSLVIDDFLRKQTRLH